MDTVTTNNYSFLKAGHFIGYKSIKFLEVHLKRGMNLIIGQNGSGKSNFLELVVEALISAGTNKGMKFKHANLTFHTRDEKELVYEVTRNISKSNQEMDYDLEERKTLTLQRLTFDGQEIFATNNDELNRSSFKKYRGRTPGQNPRNLISFFTEFIPVPLHIKFSIPESMPGIDGAGSITIPIASEDDYWDTDMSTSFLWWLVWLAESNFHTEFYKNIELANRLTEPTGKDEKEDLDKFLIETLQQDRLYEMLVIDEDIVDNLRKFSPIQDIRFNKNLNIFHDERRIVVENIKLEFFVNNTWLPWSQMSDGTKRMFYLISEVTYRKDGIILIEEPEIGIHPHQFDLIMQFLKEQSAYKQFIISTHSPKALDHLDPDELDKILIAKYVSGAGTVLNNLDEVQMEKAKAYMDEVGFLSDYWLMSDLEG